ncbi:MAG: hypothetical protein R3C20_03435 [Planctomycetaceae bacterium]
MMHAVWFRQLSLSEPPKSTSWRFSMPTAALVVNPEEQEAYYVRGEALRQLHFALKRHWPTATGQLKLNPEHTWSQHERAMG